MYRMKARCITPFKVCVWPRVDDYIDHVAWHPLIVTVSMRYLLVGTL